MKKTQVYISDEDREQVLRLAKRSGCKQSEIVREAIHEYCRRHSGNGYQEALKEVFGVLRETPLNAGRLRTDMRKGFERE